VRPRAGLYYREVAESRRLRSYRAAYRHAMENRTSRAKRLSKEEQQAIARKAVQAPVGEGEAEEGSEKAIAW